MKTKFYAWALFLAILNATSAFAEGEPIANSKLPSYFVGGNLGGALETEGPGNKLLLNYGVKVGVLAGNLGETQIGVSLSYDRASQKLSIPTTSNTGLGASVNSTESATAIYNDLNLAFLFSRVANSGFYGGPNIGLAVLAASYDNAFSPGQSFTNFELGAEMGYEYFLSDRFSMGPDLRYEHVFQSNHGENLIKATFAGNFYI